VPSRSSVSTVKWFIPWIMVGSATGQKSSHGRDDRAAE